mmetsp:Transcript_37537/g.79151  ORF Transcript_37537/g.79151 Transcript_37537/m.79151 type:complete len:584 (-) Transcript_37537:1357-3108(-)
MLVKVDIIIAVYNAESTIEETIESALHQVIPDHLVGRLCSHFEGLKVQEDGTVPTTTVIQKNASSNGIIQFDVCVCCYNDASTDKSLEIIESMEKEHTWNFSSSKSSEDEACCEGIIQSKLLVGTAPPGTTSRGAGYARNQAVKLRDKYEKNTQKGTPQPHFLCILDSDDIMHPTRVAEQACAMLSLDNEERHKTLMGCQFDRIPKDSTQHYSQWANSLSNERLYLEQFRECTLLQPTWFLSKKWFEQLGGYLEAPASDNDETSQSKRAKTDSGSTDTPIPNNNMTEDAHDDADARNSANGSGEGSKQFYQLFHPSEILESTISNSAIDDKKRKYIADKECRLTTLRLAEDSRIFYAHLQAGGRLRLHRTPTPLVSYRHRSGMSQSSNTPRKLLLKLRAKAWEDIVFHANTDGACSESPHTVNNTKWSCGFAIWGAGRDGKDFLKALSPACRSKVVCFVDVDQKKIEKIKWYDNPDLRLKRLPILHYSVLAKNKITDEAMFGRIDKKCGGDDFNVVSKNPAQTKATILVSKTKKNQTHDSINPNVLQQLPVVVCVAMYRTNGALESNVASIGRVEGKDLWHII